MCQEFEREWRVDRWLAKLRREQKEKEAKERQELLESLEKIIPEEHRAGFRILTR